MFAVNTLFFYILDTNMLVKSNSQYDSFLFWRQPIPALDLSELEGLNLMDSIPTNSSQGKDEASQFTTKSKQDEVGIQKADGSNPIALISVRQLVSGFLSNAQ